MMIWIVPLLAAVVLAAGFLRWIGGGKGEWSMSDAMLMAVVTLIIAAGTYALVWCICMRIEAWANLAGL